MKVVKILLSLFFMVGAVAPIISVTFFDSEHRVILAPIAVISAFIGTGLMFGFSNFRTRPKYIGNFDSDNIKPDINQTWMVFFITLVINLLFANLCGY